MDTQQLAQHLRSLAAGPPSIHPQLLRGHHVGFSDAAAGWIVELEDFANAEVQESALVEAIRAAGVPDELAGHLAQTVQACALVAGTAQTREYAGSSAPVLRSRAQGLLGAVETLASVGGRLDAVLISATGQLTGAKGRVLLAEKGASSPEELDTTQQERWRARAKSLTRGEVRAAIGWGEGEVSDLVALATAPRVVLDPVRGSLATGESCWRLARRFWREAGPLPHEDGAAVANALFGSDPLASVTERLTSDGEFTQRPWVHKLFYRALDREVAKLLTKDPKSARRTRERQLSESDVWVTVDRDGVGSVGIRCPNTQASAIADRIEAGARRARALGDQRSLRQLRTALVAALLLHGRLPEVDGDTPAGEATPDTNSSPTDCTHEGDRAGLITIDHTTELDQVLTGLPSATINVIVPLGTLLPELLPTLGLTDGTRLPEGSALREGSAHCRTCTCTCQQSPVQQSPVRQGPAEQQPEGDRHNPPSDAAPDAPPPDAVPGTAEVTGIRPHFISPAEARELALAPGSTLHRLVTDPLSGRCLERSTKAYRFDKQMRTQIAFADHVCRAPGCTVPAALCQFDHVQEFGTPGGETSEANGALAHGVDHQRKTEKLWDAVIAPNRDVTWTTMLGRIYRTKAHDYRQYDKLLTAAIEQVHENAQEAGLEGAIDAAVYAALSYRPVGNTLQTEDDWEEPDRFPGWDLITLTHTDALGQRRYQPDPTVAGAERSRFKTTDPKPDRDETGDDKAGDRDDSGNNQGTTGWDDDPGPPPF